jgi:hypothetical protein
MPGASGGTRRMEISEEGGLNVPGVPSFVPSVFPVSGKCSQRVPCVLYFPPLGLLVQFSGFHCEIRLQNNGHVLWFSPSALFMWLSTASVGWEKPCNPFSQRNRGYYQPGSNFIRAVSPRCRIHQPHLALRIRSVSTRFGWSGRALGTEKRFWIMLWPKTAIRFQNPIVVEGYCGNARSAHQLRFSRSRAILVRQYLQN